MTQDAYAKAASLIKEMGLPVKSKYRYPEAVTLLDYPSYDAIRKDIKRGRLKNIKRGRNCFVPFETIVEHLVVKASE